MTNNPVERTEAQREAARLNGAKSKGPKTPEGKAVSSQNARKHGLSARKFLLEDEEREDFNGVLAEYNDTFAPANRVEADLVQLLAFYQFRLERAIALAACSSDRECAKQDEIVTAEIVNPDRDLILARAVIERNKSGDADAFFRYENHFSRLYNRTLRNLRAIQKDCRQQPCAEPVPAPAPQPPKEERLYSINDLIGSGAIPSLLPGAERTAIEKRPHIIRPQNEPEPAPSEGGPEEENAAA